MMTSGGCTLQLLTLKFLAIAALALTSSLSTAGLVVQTVASNSGQSYAAVMDTDTALEWLSPTATQGLSVTKVLDGAAGWVQSGFRYATSTELITLFQHAGVPVASTGTTGRETFYDSGSIAAGQSLLLNLGWTYQNNPPSPGDTFGQREMYGILADLFLGDGQSPASHYYATLGASSISAYANVPGGQWRYDNEDSLVGSFLVRATQDVPEPGTLALVGTALAATCLTRRPLRRATAVS